MKNDFRNELIDGLKELSKSGFRCFILKENPSYLYGYIITPNDNIIYIQRDSFEWRGWTTTLKYVPSSKNGSGCRCEEEPFQNITAEQILKSEKEGLAFARKLKATLYSSSEEYQGKLWNSAEYDEVMHNG